MFSDLGKKNDCSSICNCLLLHLVKVYFLKIYSWSTHSFVALLKKWKKIIHIHQFPGLDFDSLVSKNSKGTFSQYVLLISFLCSRQLCMVLQSSWSLTTDLQGGNRENKNFARNAILNPKSQLSLSHLIHQSYISDFFS